VVGGAVGKAARAGHQNPPDRRIPVPAETPVTGCPIVPCKARLPDVARPPPAATTERRRAKSAEDCASAPVTSAAASVRATSIADREGLMTPPPTAASRGS